MDLCVISWDYPDSSRSVFPFVKQLVLEFVSQGHHVCVISPYSLSANRKRHSEREVVSERLTVLRPGYLSLSNLSLFGISFSDLFHKRAVNRALRKMRFRPDVIYGHFWKSAYEASSFSIKMGIPLFVASGESSVEEMFPKEYRKKEFLDIVKGVICVSTKNKNESVGIGLISADKCVVFPNAVNASLFHAMDRNVCRERIGIPKDVFIVCFVGGMIERKGPLRVSDAIKRLKGEAVYSFFIGKGEQTPDCDNILFNGALPHDEIPFYLNAADVFVLPTLHEGCCNAVVEAMACGLPIISSNRSFNLDVLNEDNSILIDPTSVNAISEAIKDLRDDEDRRNKLSRNALEVAKHLTIENRARLIIEFIQSRV